MKTLKPIIKSLKQEQSYLTFEELESFNFLYEPANTVEIEEAEESLGHRIPESLREFYSISNELPCLQ